MAKAFQDIEDAKKEKTNPHFRAKYADLGAVVDAIKPALKNHGLWFSQVSYDIEHAASIETVIIHSSGEWLSTGIVSVPVSKSDAQGFGSALTYARRYSLSAAFGVAPEDDDANSATKPHKVRPMLVPKNRPIEQLTAMLQESTSIAELQIVWTEMNKEEQAACEIVKNQVKERLMK